MANTLDQRILGLIKKYMEKLVQKKVLTSMEEVEANTNGTNLVAAPVVAELNNKLGGFQPIVDPSTGKITAYKTDVGGADTVFPFKTNYRINFRLRLLGPGFDKIENGYMTIVDGKVQTVSVAQVKILFEVLHAGTQGYYANLYIDSIAQI